VVRSCRRYTPPYLGEVGSDVNNCKVSDEVLYAGEFTRDGSNAEYQAVDERFVGMKSKSLGFADASAFPLTTIYVAKHSLLIEGNW
jgi:NADPH:quinone reductase-like Zn-dependent oxidoreductase